MVFTGNFHREEQELTKDTWVDIAFREAKKNNFSELQAILDKVGIEKIVDPNEKAFAHLYTYFCLKNSEKFEAAIYELSLARKEFELAENFAWTISAMIREANLHVFLGNKNAAQRIFEEGMARVDANPDLNLLSRIYHDYAVFLFRQYAETTRPIYLFQKSFDIDKKLMCPGDQIFSIINLMSCYRVVGDTPSALALIKVAREIMVYARKDINSHELYLHCNRIEPTGFRRVEVEQTRNFANILLNYGLILSNLGSPSGALNVYEEVRDLIERTNNIDQKLLVTDHLGAIYFDAGDFIRAERCYKHLVGYYGEHAPRSYEYVVALSNLAHLALEGGRHAEAESYMNVCLNLANEMEVVNYQILSHQNFGKLYTKLGKYPEAIEHLEEGLGIAQKSHRIDAATRLFRLLGTACLNVDVRKAKASYERAMLLAEQHSIKSEQAQIYKELSAYYKLMGESSLALFHFEKYSTLKEEMYTDEADTKLRNLYVLHEIDRYRNTLEESESKVKQLESAVFEKESELKNLSERIAEKQEFIEAVEQGLQKILEIRGEKNKAEARDLLDTLNATTPQNINVKDFHNDFLVFHAPFGDAMQQNYPDLTSAEIKICILIRLSLNSKQIAEVLQVNNRTIENHRFHIRQKLGIRTNQKLNRFLLEFE